MQEIFIVIAFEEIVSQDGNKIVKYDDNTEKFISDKQVADDYYEYLKQKNVNPNYNVAMQKLEIVSSIDIKQLLFEDAINKLTTSEREVIIKKEE